LDQQKELSTQLMHLQDWISTFSVSQIRCSFFALGIAEKSFACHISMNVLTSGTQAGDRLAAKKNWRWLWMQRVSNCQCWISSKLNVCVNDCCYFTVYWWKNQFTFMHYCQDGHSGLLVTIRYGSTLPGRRLSAGLRRRSSSAALSQLKDMCCQKDLQQLWRQMLCCCRSEAVEQSASSSETKWY